MRTPHAALYLVTGVCLLVGRASLLHAGVTDTPLPTFSDGTPAVLVAVIPAVVKHHDLQTEVLCTNLGTVTVDVGLEVFDEMGTLGNSIGAGNGALLGVVPGQTVTIATGGAALLHEDAVVTLETPVRNGSARVVATSSAVGCVALVVDRLHTIEDPATCPTCQPPSLAALPVSTSSPTPTPGACGDADGSGAITVTDGVQILRAAAGLPSPCTTQVCDVDGNGLISVTDAVNVLRAAAGLPAILSCGR